MPEPTGLTIGAIARRFGVQDWQVRRLFTRGILPEPGRSGPFRIVSREDVPRIEAALREGGYIPTERQLAAVGGTEG